MSGLFINKHNEITMTKTMSAQEAANYVFEKRIVPAGWACILLGGENFSAFPIGAEVQLPTGVGYACGECGAVLVRRGSASANARP